MHNRALRINPLRPLRSFPPLYYLLFVVSSLSLVIGGVIGLRQIALRPDGSRVRSIVCIGDADHDFGVVTQGTRLSHIFKLKNIVDDSMEITNVATSCGCTSAASVDGKRLRPGECLEFPVTVDTAQKVGHFVGRTFVHCRRLKGISLDPISIELAVIAVIQPNFSVEKPRIYLGNIQDGVIAKERIVLTSRTAELMARDKLRAQSSNNQFKIDLESVSSHQCVYAVRFPTHPVARGGRYSTTVSFYYGNEEIRHAQVMINADYLASINAEPSSLTFGSSSSRVGPKVLNIVSRGRTRIIALDCAAPEVEYTVLSPRCFSERHVIRIGVTDRKRRGIFETKLSIKLEPETATSSSEACDVEIPILSLGAQN